MKIGKTFKTTLGLFCAVLLLAGCGSAPALEAISADVPGATDLSGRWQLVMDPGAVPPPPAEQTIRIPPRNASRDPGRQPRQRSSTDAVRVFLESGEALKITQTRTALFISFDRAVVEEYTFGENRTISVGPIEAQRVSGWRDGVFVVETLDEDGARLTESWRLADGGRRLVRDVKIVQGDKQKLSMQEQFQRD